MTFPLPQVFGLAGSLLITGLASVVIPTIGWRWLICITSIPGILLLMAFMVTKLMGSLLASPSSWPSGLVAPQISFSCSPLSLFKYVSQLAHCGKGVLAELMHKPSHEGVNAECVWGRAGRLEWLECGALVGGRLGRQACVQITKGLEDQGHWGFGRGYVLGSWYMAVWRL